MTGALAAWGLMALGRVRSGPGGERGGSAPGRCLPASSPRAPGMATAGEVVVYDADLPRSALSEFDLWDDPASPGGRLVGTPEDQVPAVRAKCPAFQRKIGGVFWRLGRRRGPAPGVEQGQGHRRATGSAARSGAALAR